MLEKLIAKITRGEGLNSMDFPYHIGNNYFNVTKDSQDIIRHVNIVAPELPEVVSHIFDIPSLSSISLKGKLPKNFNIQNDCSHIFSLKLNNTGLKDDSLTFLTKFSSLDFLDLSINQLETFPKEVANLEDLKILNLSHNYFRVIDARTINSLQLDELYMGYCKITKFNLPDNLSHSIKLLDLSHNKLRDLVFENPKLIKLEILTLSNNNIKFFDPDLLVPELRLFDISNNPIEHIPEFLKKLEKLETLNLEGTRVKAQINIKDNQDDISKFLNNLP